MQDKPFFPKTQRLDAYSKRLPYVKDDKLKIRVGRGCPNSRPEIAVGTIFFTLPPNVCGPSVWKFLRVTILKPRILRWLLD
jgi:hypothetical protein